MPEKRYEITMTETQRDVMMRALDLFARIHLGQLGRIADEFTSSLEPEPFQELREKLEDLNGLAVPGAHRCGGPGIFNMTVSDRAKIARDMERALAGDTVVRASETQLEYITIKEIEADA